jgi:tetratricopeptide (TPR) repeat protein
MTGARALLEEAADEPDTSRTLDHNIWLYTELGDICAELGEVEAAREHYEQAHGFDPRDKRPLEALSDLLLEHAELGEEADPAAIRALLVHHRASLAPERRATLYRYLGHHHLAAGDMEPARARFEQALADNPEDGKALEGLLEVVSEIGEPTDILDVRRRLIDSFESARRRSQALLEMANDWIETFSDRERALDALERAIAEHDHNQEAWERLAEVSRELGDWQRLYTAYLRLSRLAEDDEARADFLIQASEVAVDRLWEPDRALPGFERALRLDPSRLDAFKSVTEILLEAEDWAGLERAYLEAIESFQAREDAGDELLAVLWSKLGDLYAIHLDRDEEAIDAYEHAVELVPDNSEVHDKIARLAKGREGERATEIRHLKELRRLRPDDDELLDRLGRAYLRQKRIDEAYCHFRGLRFRTGGLGERPEQFIRRFDRPMFREPNQKITEDLLQEFVYPEGLERHINRVFTIMMGALQEWTAERRSDIGVSRADSIDPSEPLVFNNIYTAIAESLEFGENPPDLWRSGDKQGLRKAPLKPAGLLVDEVTLGGGDETKTAFNVARQLFLTRGPFYLVGLRPMSDLQAFFLLAVDLVDSEFELDKGPEMQDAYRALDRGISGEEREHLEYSVRRATDDGREVAIGDWMELVEDASNRVGLLFCDSLEAVDAGVHGDPLMFSQRSVEQRIEDVVQYSTSDRYMALRDKLGIAVSV